MDGALLYIQYYISSEYIIQLAQLLSKFSRSIFASQEFLVYFAPHKQSMGSEVENPWLAKMSGRNYIGIRYPYTSLSGQSHRKSFLYSLSFLYSFM